MSIIKPWTAAQAHEYASIAKHWYYMPAHIVDYRVRHGAFSINDPECWRLDAQVIADRVVARNWGHLREAM